jgi:hypothetical protein
MPLFASALRHQCKQQMTAMDDGLQQLMAAAT